MSRDPEIYLDDIRQACTRILEYTANLSQEQLLADQMRMDAVIRNIEIIGEATKNLPTDLRENYSEIPWNKIAGMRDIVAHG